ncbi:M20 family metallopeptidase [Actinospica sp.]|jgi:hippurate hydrolase|uniref:M20 metallopeptidase family protein n=1 Tax=Actinospica sp. TaxID=1872142 RepID=UPI002C517D29|nr:M20 family metallopeptidase [Actinospica sp.]HWG26931.1 M20 family metallopeptidase [Actinospica sp.]
MSNDAAAVTADAQELAPELAELRRAIHREPELGLELPRTQEKVLGALDGLGLELTLGKALNSVTGVLRGARPGPTVLLRGDMDALPLRETAVHDVQVSRFEGVMHACGHDLHTSMLVGAARLLTARRESLAGNVVFMFQPGEEGEDGAGHMLAEGLLDASGAKPDAAYALHVFSNQVPRGVFTAKAGPLMASCADLRVTVRGRGGHGSMPYRANDPIPAACEMVTAIQTAVTRKFDIFDPVVVTVGSFHGGTKENIIPETVHFDATVRTFSQATQEKVRPVLLGLIEGIAHAHGLEVDASFAGLYPVTVNDAAAVDTVQRTVGELFGEERFERLPNPLAGAEDFSRVLQRVPGAMVFLGAAIDGRDVDTAPSNHSPEAAFDDGVLPDGAALLARLALGHVA